MVLPLNSIRQLLRETQQVEIWIPFALATTLILIIPGPTIILVISQAVTHGRKSVVPLVAGVILGDFTAMTLSLLGLGALLSASAALFSAFKWIGAIYLIYLGIKLWKLNPENDATQYIAENTSARALLCLPIQERCTLPVSW